MPADHSTRTRSPGPSPHVGGDLRIHIHLHLWVDYVGTRAQLGEEGLVPSDAEWSDQCVTWMVGRQWAYHLKRARKSVCRSSDAPGDCWHLRVRPCGAIDHGLAQIKIKGADLSRHLYLRTPQGRAELFNHLRRAEAACRDQKYQAFKSMIPGLLPRKGGRAVG